MSDAPPPQSLSEARVALAAGEAPPTVFARALIAHPVWRVPCSAETLKGDEFVVRTVHQPGDAEGADAGDWLPAFSSEAAHQAYVQAVGASTLGDHFVEMPGELLFANLDNRLAGIDLDPHTPDAIHYKGEQLDLLRALAAAWPVEEVLRGVDVPDGILRLAEHDGYGILLAGEELLLAPDDQGRRLAAVATAPDTLAAWQAHVLANGFANLSVVTLSGRDLFSRLARMPLTGVVFNPSGPVAPRAVSLDLAQVILQAAATASPTGGDVPPDA